MECRFYAAVEMRDNPDLRGKPVAVGGIKMICTANYEARKYGVRAAMPGFIATRLCPNLVFVPTNFDKYRQVAEQTREIFRQYDPNFEAMSLDEAYLDLTDYMQQHPQHTPSEVVAELRSRIFQITQLTASAGIACNSKLAKICSDVNKPNGQFELKSDEESIRFVVV
jgi:DNA polymerase kappa